MKKDISLFVSITLIILIVLSCIYFTYRYKRIAFLPTFNRTISQSNNSLPERTDWLLELNYHDIDYTLHITSSKSYSVIFVYESKYMNKVCVETRCSDNSQIHFNTTLTLYYKDIKMNAQWHHIYFISQSDNIKSISYEDIFQNNVEDIKETILKKEDCSFIDSVEAYLESNPTIIQ